MDNENNENNENNQIEYVIQNTDKPMDFFTRLVSVFVSPVKLMENINKFPKMAPVLVVFILTGILSAIAYPKYMEIYENETSLIMIERYGTDYTNISGYTEALGQGANNAIYYSSAVSGSITSPYISSLFATVVLMLLCFIARVKPKFTHFYSMYLHTAVLASVMGLISLYFMVLTESTVDVLALAGFIMPNGNYLNPVYMALSAVSVSNIWQTVLVYIGLKALTGCTGTKALVLSATMLAIIIAYTGAGALIAQFALDFSYSVTNSLSI